MLFLNQWNRKNGHVQIFTKACARRGVDSLSHMGVLSKNFVPHTNAFMVTPCAIEAITCGFFELKTLTERCSSVCRAETRNSFSHRRPL